MSTTQDRLAGSGWQQQIVEVKVGNAKKKISDNNYVFGELLESAMKSRAFDEDVIDFLTDQFPLPLPLVSSKEELEKLGYCVLNYTTLDYSRAKLGWPRAIVDLKEIALSSGLTALGKPEQLEQYLEVSARHGKARQKWCNETLVNPLFQYPEGKIVASWDEKGAWFTSSPVYNDKGDIIGYDYTLLYKDAQYVQTCCKDGLMITIHPDRYYFLTPQADFETSEFGTWSEAGGMLDFFSQNLFEKSDQGRAAVLVLGPSGGGKTSFIRSILKEKAQGYAIFRITPSEFPQFEYPTFLEKVIIVVEDVEDMIPPRGSGRRGSDAVLAKLEFNPLLASANKGKITHFGLFCTCNTLTEIDHAALENVARFDQIYYLDPSAWKVSTAKRKIVVVNSDGVSMETIPTIVQRATESVSNGLH
jgi:adenylate kinase family enzyme